MAILHFINKNIFPNVSRETRPNNAVMRVLSAENHWRSLKFQSFTLSYAQIVYNSGGLSTKASEMQQQKSQA